MFCFCHLPENGKVEKLLYIFDDATRAFNNILDVLFLTTLEVEEPPLPLFYINNSRIFTLKKTGYHKRLLKDDSIQHENLLPGFDSETLTEPNK